MFSCCAALPTAHVTSSSGTTRRRRPDRRGVLNQGRLRASRATGTVFLALRSHPTHPPLLARAESTNSSFESTTMTSCRPPPGAAAWRRAAVSLVFVAVLTAALAPVAATVASPPGAPGHRGIDVLVDADHSVSEGGHASDRGLDTIGAVHGGRHLLSSQVCKRPQRTLTPSFHPHRAAPRRDEPALLRPPPPVHPRP